MRLSQGHSISVINTHGTQVCDLWTFNVANLSEFLSWEHARGGINRIAPKIGDALLTNRRRPILRLTEDTSPGVHDTLIAACDLFRYIGLGVEEYHDNCSDNLQMALAAIGERATEVPQPFNVWMNIPSGRTARSTGWPRCRSRATASRSEPRWTASSSCLRVPRTWCRSMGRT